MNVQSLRLTFDLHFFLQKDEYVCFSQAIEVDNAYVCKQNIC